MPPNTASTDGHVGGLRAAGTRPVGAARAHHVAQQHVLEPREHHGIGRDARRPDRAEVLVEVDRGPLVGAEASVGQGQHRQAAGGQRGAAAGVEVVAVQHDRRQSQRHGQVGEVLGGGRRREQGEPAVGQLPLRERQAAEVAEEHDAQPAADELLGECHAPDQVTHPGGRARVAAHADGRPAVSQGGHVGGWGRAGEDTRSPPCWARAPRRFPRPVRRVSAR